MIPTLPDVDQASTPLEEKSNETSTSITASIVESVKPFGLDLDTS
jgi:hypothetical protein